jgi:O-antigen/teichoic acid export membrane protein
VQASQELFETEKGISKPRRAIATNLAWIIIEKGIAIIDAFLIGALVARYLGPTQLGYLSAAAALMAIAIPIAMLGLDRVVVRELVRSATPHGSCTTESCKSKGAESFWGLVLVRTIGGLIIFVALNAALHFGLLGHHSADELKVIQYTSISLLILPLAAPALILEATLLSKWSVWIGTFWLAISSVIRIVLVTTEAPVDSFVLASQFHSLATAVTLVLVIRHARLLPSFRIPRFTFLKSLLIECWPLAASSLAVALYMSLDVTMLRWIRGPDAAGTYSVAVQMSAVWYFLPMAIAASFLPMLSRSHANDSSEYQTRLSSFINLNVDAAIACLLVGIIAFPFLIHTLFGPSYSESIDVFRIHAFSLFFVFIGVARSQHLLLEGFHRIALVTTCAGALVNMTANLILIPRFGGQGAAVGTLLAYSVAGHASSFAFPQTRAFGNQVHLSVLKAPARLLASAMRLRRILLSQ